VAVCAVIPTGLLMNCAEALGWMAIVARRQVGFTLGALGAILVVHLAGLGVVDLAWGLVVVQWILYALTIAAFVKRGMIELGLVVRRQLVHVAVAAAAGGLAWLCSVLTAGAGLGLRLLALSAVCGLVAVALATFGARLPFRRVLDRRLAQARPGPGLVRGWLRG
jgi:hypothetical protein